MWSDDPATTPTARPLTPIGSARNTAPMMMEALYRSGANAGATKCCRALSTPVSIPEMPKKIGEMSMIRVSSTASEVSSASRPLPSPRPGASSGTSHGAPAKARSATASVARLIRLSTPEASAHAASALSRRRTRAKTGMKAAESVAPASSWKTRSGMRKAIQ